MQVQLDRHSFLSADALSRGRHSVAPSLLLSVHSLGTQKRDFSGDMAALLEKRIADGTKVVDVTAVNERESFSLLGFATVKARAHVISCVIDMVWQCSW